MTSILLHEYVEQVDKLIDDNRLVEAIEHCRHILHSYPRHIDTYRVMGKALLEKQEYDAANDLFLRILCADPNDFISHVGLSIIYKEASQFDQALWHLERAYEIQPYNVAIQGELRQLYAVETESRPGVIPLTRGALVRLYMQGELYQQAIAELRRILAEEPDRMDLQVLLAEALWRDDQRIDAEEVCLTVLQELPNCIVLNAILAEIWLQTGRLPEAQKYLHRLHSLTWQTQKSLDKETIAGHAFATEGAFLLPAEAPLDFLQTGTMMPDKSGKPSDDWVGAAGFNNDMSAGDDSLDQVVLEPESGMHSYDWLSDIGELEGGEGTAVSDEVPSETDWFSQSKAKESLNLSTGELNAEWLTDLRGDDGEAGFQPLDMEGLVDELPDGSTDDGTDWFAAGDELSDEEIDTFGADLGDTAVTLEPESTAEGLPGWLDSLDEDEPAIEIDATSLMDDSLMNWADSEPHIVEEPKTPFWLSEMADNELEAVQLNPEDALDWMNDPDDEAYLDDDLANDAPVDEDQADTNLMDIELADGALAEDDLSFLDELDLPDVVEPPAAEPEFGPTAVLDLDQIAEDEGETAVPDTDALGGSDDWLAALTEDGLDDALNWDEDTLEQIPESFAEMQLDAGTEEFASLSDADDWLQSAEADLDALLQDETITEEDFPNLAIPELEGEEFTEIPDWLDNEDIDLSEESEAAVSSENDPQKAPQPEDPEMKPTQPQDEDETSDVLNWLDNLTSDSDEDDDAGAPMPEPPIETEGMPSWLNAANEKAGMDVVDEWDSASADIPDWLQEPVDLADLDDDDGLLDKDLATDVPGLTGLLSEMDVAEEALPLDQMDSLLSDWIGEDSDGSLTELLGEMDLGDEVLDEADEFIEETAVPHELEAPELPEEPEEVGLTGLLSNLRLTEPETAESDDDFLSGIFDSNADDDLDEFLFEDMTDGDAESDETFGLTDMDRADFSLTELLSDASPEETPVEMSQVDDNDWLADLTNFAEEEEAESEAEVEAEETVGLTGLLANLWADEEVPGEETAVADTSDPDEIPSDFGAPAADELGLTELLAGIDYAEDAIASETNLDDFNFEPVEPSLTGILSEIEEIETEDRDLDLPISAEDTTWLTQLEADTGSLKEQVDDDFDMAEESGLDWLTMPDEPESESVPAVEPEIQEAKEVADPDGNLEDWDDAMSWLEDLAAQQDDPVEELPSVAETMLDEELDTAAELMATAPMDRNTDWLTELTGSDASEDLDDDAWFNEVTADVPADELLEETELELPETQMQTASDLQLGLDDLDVLDDVAEDEGEVSWLDELGTDMLAQSLMDEAETAVDVPETASVSQSDDNAWLDELLTDDSTDESWLDDAWADEPAAEESVVEELPDGATFTDALDEEDDELAVADVDTAVDEDDLGWLDAVLGEPEKAEAIDLLDADTEDEEDELDEMFALDMPVEDMFEQDMFEQDTPVEEAPVQDIFAQEDFAEVAFEDDEATERMDEEDLVVTGVTAALKETGGLVAAEADLEEALAWLDELDEDAELELQEEAPPTRVNLPHKPSELDESDLLDWADEPETLVVKPERDELVDALDRLQQQVLEEGVAVPETAVFPIALSTEELNDALDWIEQAEAAPAPAELVAEFDDEFVGEFVPETAVAADEADEIDLQGMSDDPEAWLEQLLSDDLEMDIEMQPPPIKPSEDAMFATDAGSVPAETADFAAEIAEQTPAVEEPIDSLLDDGVLEGMPEDPDAAVAWLDQMVEDGEEFDFDAEFLVDDSSAEDTDMLADLVESGAAPVEAEAEDDAFNLSDMDEDPEAWLEQMLSGDMLMDIDMQPPPIKPSEDAMFVTGDAPVTTPEPELEPIELPEAPVEVADLVEEIEAIAEEDSASLEFDEMSDDPEAWLEQMLSGDMMMDVEMEPPPIKPSEDAMFVTDAGRSHEAATEPTSEPEMQLDSEPDIFADVPDDPDEAMVWLEQLAARQGAAMDELPSVKDPEAEPDMPNWMAQDLEEMSVDPEVVEPETAVSPDFFEDETELDDDSDVELPDWLDQDADDRVVGQTGWLRALPEVDMNTWLAAEEEATLAGSSEEVALPDTGPLTAPLPMPMSSAELLDDDLFEPVLEPSTGAYSVDEAKLNVAQEALADGRLPEAIAQFKELVTAGSGMMTIIAELEQAAEAHPQTPALSQVLGDAYMRNGQLQKALGSYRTALDQM